MGKATYSIPHILCTKKRQKFSFLERVDVRKLCFVGHSSLKQNASHLQFDWVSPEQDTSSWRMDLFNQCKRQFLLTWCQSSQKIVDSFCHICSWLSNSGTLHVYINVIVTWTVFRQSACDCTTQVLYSKRERDLKKERKKSK